jgi:alpha-tubulin suppressor-like RCC1 family protein
MTTLTLGKIKLVNRGAWSATATYSKGDIVTYNNQSFIYRNETAKPYTALFFGGNGTTPTTGVFAGSIASLAANSFSFTVTLTNALQATTDNRIVAWDSTNPEALTRLFPYWFAYAKFIEPDSRITNIVVNSTTSVTITISKQTTNNSTQTNVPVTIGTRRMSGVYETVLNQVDWDLLSEGYSFGGAWSASTAYIQGTIVTKNGNSYLCIHGHSGVDPMFDYIGVWEPFLVGHDALPHQRIVTPVNSNPWGWKAHPYINKVSWGNSLAVTSTIAGATYQIATLGTTDWNAMAGTTGITYAVGNQFVCAATGSGTGTVSNCYTGVPWNLPATHQQHRWAWSYNTPEGKGYMAYRGQIDLGADGRGNRLGQGHGYYGGVSGGTDADTVREMVGEMSAQHYISYYTNEVPHYGGRSFNYNMQKNVGPRIVQNLNQWATRGMLTSTGTVLMGGNGGASSLGTGEEADFTSPFVELGRAVFNNRAIVKMAGGKSQSRDGSVNYIVLDEYGECWTWGYNGYGQCGIGPDNHLASGMRLTNGTDNVRTPMCLSKDIFFGGARIVEIWSHMRDYYVLDETGVLWSWGQNDYGQLGYNTDTGFVGTDRSRAPKAININWATYGGIQKICTPETEGEKWVLILDGQGHVWSYGYNNQGQLGTGNTTSDSNALTLPRRTSSTASWSIGGGIKNIWAGTHGNNISFFLDTSLNLWACGNGGNYEFTTTAQNYTSPTQMYHSGGAMNNILTITSGTGRSGSTTRVALDVNQITYATGWNQQGEGGIGTSSYPGNNAWPQYQSSAGATNVGWARCVMPSVMYDASGNTGGTNRVIDLWGYGDYESATAHQTVTLWLTERGEILAAGRSYNGSLNRVDDANTYLPQPINNLM